MSKVNKSYNWKDLRVGIFLLAAIGLFIFLILNASGGFNPFSKKLKLKAHFNSASGLREGSEVRLAGVRVGEVESIRMLPPSNDPNADKIEASLILDGTIDNQDTNQRIRTDSTAQLVAPSFLSDEKVINVTPGTNAGVPVKNGDLLDSTAANSISDIASSGSDLVQRLNKIADQVNDITGQIKNGKGTIGRAVNDEALYNNLNATIKDIQAVSAKIKSGEGTAGRILNDNQLYENLNVTVKQLQAIATDIRAGKGTAGKLFTDEQLYNEARATMAKVNNTVDDIRVVVADVRAGRGTAGKLFSDEALYNDTRAAISRLNVTAERIDGLAAAAQRGEGTFGKLLTDEQLYNNMSQLSGEGVKLLYDVRQNPKKFLTIKLDLF